MKPKLMGKKVHVYMRCVIICQSEELKVIRNCWLKDTVFCFLHRVFFPIFICIKIPRFLIKSHFSMYRQISTSLPKFCLLALGLTGEEHSQLVSRAIRSLVWGRPVRHVIKQLPLSPQPARNKLSRTKPGIKKPRLFMQGQKVVIRHTRKVLL